MWSESKNGFIERPGFNYNLYPEEPNDYGIYIFKNEIKKTLSESEETIILSKSILSAVELIHNQKHYPYDVAIAYVFDNLIEEKWVKRFKENGEWKNTWEVLYTINISKLRNFLKKSESSTEPEQLINIETKRITKDWKWITILVTEELLNAIKIMMEINEWISYDVAWDVLIKNYLKETTDGFKFDIEWMRLDLGISTENHLEIWTNNNDRINKGFEH